jgi:pilus assembly protein CpaE
MVSRPNILVITKEDTTANTISSIVKSNRNMAFAGVCNEVSELKGYFDHETPGAIVVDIDPDPSRLLSDLSTVATTHPETRIVVVSSRLDKELILEAMQAGARDFLRKGSVPSKLGKVLERLTQICDIAKKEILSHSVISVLSASGGCGATTVAINLADELRLISSEPVLMVDLDCCYGTVSSYLGIKGKYGIADVLNRKGPIDKDLIKSIASSYLGDFDVLVNPANGHGYQSPLLQSDKLVDAVKACRQAYRYTVVDAPRVAEDVAAKLAEVSEFVLVVLQPVVKDVRFARAILSALTRSGIEHKKIIPLVNRFKRRSTLIRLEECKEALGLDSCHRIRSDWRNAMNSINHGQPLAQVAPRSGLRRDFRKLAARIYANESSNGTEVPGGKE